MSAAWSGNSAASSSKRLAQRRRCAARGADRQVRVHPVDAAPQQPQREQLVLAQGGLGDLARDVGVAVAVAADPRPEAQEAADGDRARPGRRRDGAGQLPVQARDQVEQHRVDPVQAVADLVDHRRWARTGLVGQPQRGDLLGEVALEVGAHLRGEALLVEPPQRRRGPAELRQHRAAVGLGRVGGEHRADRHLRQQRANCSASMPREASRSTAARIVSGKVRPSAAAAWRSRIKPAGDGLVLGQVDQPEVGGERRHHDEGVVGRQVAQQGTQLGPGAGVAPRWAMARLRIRSTSSKRSGPRCRRSSRRAGHRAVGPGRSSRRGPRRILPGPSRCRSRRSGRPVVPLVREPNLVDHPGQETGASELQRDRCRRS
jgi:hypothetical protein